MGFFDKLKGAMNAVTGGAAKVTIELVQPCVFPGEECGVRITATSTGAEIKSKGVYVDFKGVEEVKFKDDQQAGKEVTKSHTTIDQEFLLSGAFVLAANESKTWEGAFRLPPTVLPSFAGAIASHKCFIRGRIEAFGNDPDSGYQPVKVGAKA